MLPHFHLSQFSVQYPKFQSFVVDSEWVKFAQSCLSLCDPMDYSSPGSSVHGILQARIMEWLAIPFSRGSSYPRDWTQVSHTAGRFFTIYLYKVLCCFQNMTSFNAQNSPLKWELLLWPLYSISPFCNVINHVHCPTWTLFWFHENHTFLDCLFCIPAKWRSDYLPVTTWTLHSMEIRSPT